MNKDAAMQTLEECRRQIDELDLRILALLNQRTLIVQQIGRVKREQSLPIYEPRREEQVFGNITDHNEGPLTSDALKRIFERVIDEMRNIQRVRMLVDEDERRP